jgi:hypothetical protein
MGWDPGIAWAYFKYGASCNGSPSLKNVLPPACADFINVNLQAVRPDLTGDAWANLTYRNNKNGWAPNELLDLWNTHGSSGTIELNFYNPEPSWYCYKMEGTQLNLSSPRAHEWTWNNSNTEYPIKEDPVRVPCTCSSSAADIWGGYQHAIPCKPLSSI